MIPRRIASSLTFCALLGATGCASTAPRAGAPAVARPPTTAELVERGRAFGAYGDLTRAEQYLSAALDHGAAPRDVLPTLVRVCVQGGRYRVASLYTANALQRDPEDPSLRLLHGILEAAVGDPRVALHEYETVLKVRPDDSDAHYAVAVLLRDTLDDPAGADFHFREYLRLSPEGAHAPDARASLLQRMP
jgi:Flp pilus assembly protein TadD